MSGLATFATSSSTISLFCRISCSNCFYISFSTNTSFASPTVSASPRRYAFFNPPAFAKSLAGFSKKLVFGGQKSKDMS